MALVSPGSQLTIVDESQYVTSGPGTTALVLLATAQDKLNPAGTIAKDSTLANSNQLLSFTSQLDLVTALGYPTFQQSASGTPLDGDERNEYGLMAAYSALGQSNLLYAIRADVNLNDLKPTSIRPKGNVADSIVWLDTADTSWGLYSWDATNGVFSKITPIVITLESQQTNNGGVMYPLQTIGNITDYAMVFSSLTTAINIFHKNDINNWVQLGSVTWQASAPAVASNVFVYNQIANTPAVSGTADTIKVNGITVTVGDTTTTSTVNGVYTKINLSSSTLNAAGIYASITPTGQIRFAATKNAISGDPNNTFSVTATAVGTNYITCASTASLQIGDPVVFTGTTFGGISASTIVNAALSTSHIYYVNNIIDGTHFTVSTTPGGASAVLTTATGTCACVLIDGAVRIVNHTTGGNPLTLLGITAGTYYAASYTEGTFAQIPSWLSSDARPRPTGSVFLKISSVGDGANFDLKQYSAAADTWNRVPSPVYGSDIIADYSLDPVSGGLGIPAGTIYVKTQYLNATSSSAYEPRIKTVGGPTVVTGLVPTNAISVFAGGDIIVITVSQPGTATPYSVGFVVPGSGNVSVTNFVVALAGLAIPNFSITVSATGAIVVTHPLGGEITFLSVSGSSAAAIFYPNSQSGKVVGLTAVGNTYTCSNWSDLTYTVGAEEPYTNPAQGQLWYYGDATTVDIMINDNGWRGYKSAHWSSTVKDARGYNLAATDPNGVIVSASKPVYQADGVTAVAAGDIWLDTSDLENWPLLSRYNGSTWVKIDNTDQVNQNGIVFADVRWDSTGTSDIINDPFPSTQTMLTSDYVDLDAPDYRLYPRGMLLLNMRRSGFNIKKFEPDYFTAQNYPNVSLPTMASTWVTASGLQDNGAMWAGRQAQRNVVVSSLAAAISTNTTVREEQFQFNLICAPGYPELIPDMVALNNDRANTAFVIGDTPFRLTPDSVSLSDWANNTGTWAGKGLSTADPYLAVYYPSAQTTDLSGNSIVVPPSHVALRTFIHNDNVSYQWFAPAGTRRGLVDNATNIGYINSSTEEFTLNGISQGTRDLLYTNKINPITQIPGIGLVVWGQITRNPTATSLDRVNVARLVNYIRSILAKVGDAYLFEPNDKITRDQIKSIISGAINDLIAKRGIYDYVVVCDDSNNTPTRVERNELWVDIAIEPMKSVEFIYIPIRLKNPGDIKAGI